MSETNSEVSMKYELWPIGKKLPKKYSASIEGHHIAGSPPVFRSPTWQSWYAMVARCYIRSMGIASGGGCYTYQRDGIQVYYRWVFGDGTKCGFLCFLEDMGERPSLDHTLSRSGDVGNYIPGNVKWEIQSTTRRKKKAA